MADSGSSEGEHPEVDARFSLANERTLLAYQRTAIALIAAAIAVVHFFGDGVVVALFGVALLLTGGVAVVGGYLQFRRVERAMAQGRPIGGGPAAHTLSLAMLVCLLLAAVYVLTRGF